MRKARCLLTLSLGVWGLTHAAAAPADPLAAELALCATVDDASSRLACYDRVAARVPGSTKAVAGKLAPEQPVDGDAVGIGGPASGNTAQVEDSAGAETAPERPQWLGMRPYRRNYILPVSYNSRDEGTTVDRDSDGFELDDIEIKFQFSFELPVWENLLDSDVDLYFAYTQLSFFQAYNTEYSSPFRDTSYEPELGLNWQPDLELGQWRIRSARAALNHQSNGRSEPLSRSWNRVVGQLQASRGDLDLGLRLWHRLEENREDDDNPDITDFLGHGEFFAGYKIGRHHLGLMLRNPAKHLAAQLDWSYDLTDQLKFYVQYFNGYGESLIDYDRQVNRIGAGFLLNHWP